MTTMVPKETPDHAASPEDTSASVEDTSSLNDDTEATSQSDDQDHENNAGDQTARYQHILPPCKVCGTQATGFHYGINSCEACKGFFRRSILRKKEYRCSKNTKCLLKPGKHKLCPYCRFKRCLAVGMSVNGIKTGRYTYEKRTKDILELKLLEQSESVVNDSNNQDETKHLMSLAQDVRIQADKLLEDMHAVWHSPEVEQKQRQFLIDPNSMLSALSGEKLQKAGKYITSTILTSESIFNSNLAAPSKTTPCEDKMTSGDKTNNDNDDTKPFYIRSSQREIHVTLSENGQTLTDSDVDVKLAWFRTIEFGIRCLVRFIKAVPGFRNIHIDDQLNLIKHSFLEAWLISRHKMFNTAERVYTAANGFTLDIGLTVHRDMFSIVLRNVRRLQALGLNAEETYILQAVVQLFPDRCEMRNYEQVEQLQNHYLQILQCLLKVNHKEDRLIFPKILSILTELRDITDVFYKTSTQTNGNLPLIKNSAPLLMEMVTSVRP